MQPAEGIALKSLFPAMQFLVVLVNDLASGALKPLPLNLVRSAILTHAAAS